ncbi:MAG: RDD family protein [Gemmatimonadales bacterium]
MTEGRGVPQREGAGVAVRAAATVADLVLLFLIFAAFDAFWGTDEPGLAVRGAPAVYLFLVVFLYYVLFEAFAQGTPGKMVSGLRIVRADGGGRIGMPEAILRTVLRIVDAFPYLVPYLVAALVVGPLKRNQRVGDLVAKTLVIRK